MGLSSWLLCLVCEEHEAQAEEHEQHYEKKKNLIKFNLRFFFKFKKKILRWLFLKIEMQIWHLKKAK